MAQWLDSHAHLFSEEFTDREDAIERAKNAGFGHILIVCCSLEEAEKAIERAKNDPMLDVAVGFHPCDIMECNEAMWNKLEELVNNPTVVAVGEIGLDLYWNPDTLAEQQNAFIRQIELANQVQKPILVHSRDAISQTYQLMKKHPADRRGILHCFSSSAEMAKEFVKLGYMISLGGPVTFKNAKVPKEVAVTVPLDHLLIETDCPYLTPHPHRGKRNEPMYAALSGKEIASLRKMEEESLQQALEENYKRLFYRGN